MDSTLQIVNSSPRRYPVALSIPTAQPVYVTLPSEIIREIVETVAYEDRTYASNLCLVSRTFHAWVCPILYRVLRVDSGKIDRWVLGGPSKLRRGMFKSTPKQPSLAAQARLEQYGLNTKRLSKFGPFVKAILVQDKPVRIAVQILQSCVNVRDLSLWLLQGSTPPLRSVLNSLPLLKRLSLDPTHVLGRVPHPPHFELVQPFFRQLTHLEIIHAWDSLDTLSHWNATRDLGPSRMPKLTHLALHFAEKKEFFPSLVHGCPQLRVIAFLGTPTPRIVAQRVPKVVFVRKFIPGYDLLSGWEHSALVGGGFWDRAESELVLATNGCGSPSSQSLSVQEPQEPTSWQTSLGSREDSDYRN